MEIREKGWVRNPEYGPVYLKIRPHAAGWLAAASVAISRCLLGVQVLEDLVELPVVTVGIANPQLILDRMAAENPLLPLLQESPLEETFLDA